jgi:riboflavin kinase/FMN adenylyltransferase
MLVIPMRVTGVTGFWSTAVYTGLPVLFELVLEDDFNTLPQVVIVVQPPDGQFMQAAVKFNIAAHHVHALITIAYTGPFPAVVTDPWRSVSPNIEHDKCHAVSIIVGHDCRFGKGAKGNFELLQDMAGQYEYEIAEVPPVIVEAERVSSTLIRERVLLGDLDTVEKLLGRKYSITGVVSRGRGMGEKLGFPTANVKPNHNAVPAQGVYVAESIVKGHRLPSAVNIGIAPTIRHEDITIEAHILDFDEDIRDAEIEIVFHKRIRTEKKFPNLEALVAQIKTDVQTTREYFSI